MATPAQIASGQSNSGAGDLTLLAGAPRWVERASTNVFLRFTTRWQTMIQEARRASQSPAGPGPLATVAGSIRMFNKDQSSLPQNETSVAIDPTNLNRIVGGYNDYRGLATGGFTGWAVSTDSGATVSKDGQVPSFRYGDPEDGVFTLTSQGDPSVDTDKEGNFFLGGLHFNPSGRLPNGISVARSPKAGSPTGVFSTACTGGLDPDCWPTIGPVWTNDICSSNEGGNFEDKPYIAVDKTTSVAAGHVYVVWTRFPCAYYVNNGPYIMIAKCSNDVSSCTHPVLVDTSAAPWEESHFVQLSHIAIGPDGSVYVSWVRHGSQTEGLYRTERDTIMIRKIMPTSATYGGSVGTIGPIQTVHVETRPIPWKYAPFPARYRTATYPHVAVDGSRVIVVWDRRTSIGLGRSWWFDYGTTASIVAKYSDDGGVTWSGEQTVSNAWGPQYQPSVCVDSTAGRVVVAYFSHQNDPVFAHGQDVYVATSSHGAAPYTASRITPVSNDTEADPRLADVFIGDYLEVACRGGRAYVHFTANYSTKWFGVVDGAFFSRQQDNFIARVTLP